MSGDLRIGLALGGGGARGMAHILVCEAFDELGIKPALIAGTSIGAIIGAGYAAGFSGRDMRNSAVAFYAKRREVLGRLWRARPLAFTDLLRGRSLTPQFDARTILNSFVPGIELLPETFEELAIPLKIVTCDFYAWKEAVLSSGPLRPAIAASVAIPALFRPVELNGRFLIDGGACNPLPFEHVADCASDGRLRRRRRAVGDSRPSAGAARMRRRGGADLHAIGHPGKAQMDTAGRAGAAGDQRRLHHGFPEDADDPRLKRRLQGRSEAAAAARHRDALRAPALLPAGAKEAAQKRGGRGLADTGINLWRMVTGGRVKEADPVLDPAPLGIAGPVVKPAQAREGNGGRA